MSVLPNPYLVFLPFLLWIAFGPFYIRFLKAKMFGQYIREEGPQSHQKKAGTPTMGGLFILLAVLVVLVGMTLVFPHALTPNIAWVLLVLVVFGLLGFSDDYLKVTKHKNKGLSGWSKLFIQVLIGLGVGFWEMHQPGGTQIDLFGHGHVDVGWLYPLIVTFMITGGSNAYNLTDGLDGLAGSTGFVTFIGFAFLLVGHPDLRLVSLILAGSCLGFLVFNRYPAKIFMGDTGSLALGGIMGAIAVLGKLELYLLLLGGLYILETLSVILQVLYFKATHGKRLFKMSPLHHHFELSGWKEPTVVWTFLLLQALLTFWAVILYNTKVS